MNELIEESGARLGKLTTDAQEAAARAIIDYSASEHHAEA
jgi:hypothetical protein